jgi:hypothetical protein
MAQALSHHLPWFSRFYPTLSPFLYSRKSKMSEPSYALFCMGNPLLDIQVTNGEELLKKYNLNANDAILADEKRLPMWISFIFSQN